MSNGRVFLALNLSVCTTKRDISLHNIQPNIWKIKDGGCWHVRFVPFVTILLNRHHRSRRFIYFKALFTCKKHQGKIYKTQRVLVTNLATNFWILVASTIILVALATVLAAISCPALAWTHGVQKRSVLARAFPAQVLCDPVSPGFELPAR